MEENIRQREERKEGFLGRNYRGFFKNSDRQIFETDSDLNVFLGLAKRTLAIALAPGTFTAFKGFQEENKGQNLTVLKGLQYTGIDILTKFFFYNSAVIVGKNLVDYLS